MREKLTVCRSVFDDVHSAGIQPIEGPVVDLVVDVSNTNPLTG